MSKQVGRGWSLAAREQFWKAWKQGVTVKDIAQMMGVTTPTAHRYAKRHGGIAPPMPRRSERALSQLEREEVSRGIVLNLSIREIARRMNRSPSTVSRELARNGGRERYRAAQAEAQYLERLRRPKMPKLAQNPRLCATIASKLLQDWSPEQIVGWLNKRYPTRREMRVSQETIYRSLFVQSRGLLKKELMAHLRRAKVMRHAKKAPGSNPIKDAISIRERPPEVEDRAVPGHWEGDLIEGSNNSYIITLVERQTRYVMLRRIANRDSTTVLHALTEKIGKLPTELRRTLTWDRGTEMAQHAQLSVDADIAIYFCDPYSPWQRGTNENTNGLLRQYFPKGTDLSVHTQAHLNRVAMLLNTRPRKTLDFDTPAARLQALLR